MHFFHFHFMVQWDFCFVFFVFDFWFLFLFFYFLFFFIFFIFDFWFLIFLIFDFWFLIFKGFIDLIGWQIDRNFFFTFFCSSFASERLLYDFEIAVNSLKVLNGIKQSFYRFDAEGQQETMAKYGVKSLPCLKFFKHGRVYDYKGPLVSPPGTILL